MLQHQFDNGTCTICHQSKSMAGWWRLSAAGCPGVPWLRIGDLAQYPHLVTRTTLRKTQHKPAKGQKPAACYFSRTGKAYRWLYDVREAVPRRAATPRQVAVLDHARELAQAARLCSWCGVRVRSKVALAVMADGHRLCGQCSRRWEIASWTRGVLASPSGYVILDTETTGLYASGGAEVVELAVLGLDGAPLVDTLIRPRDGIPADCFIAQHGITDALVQDAPSFAAVYDQFAQAIAGKTVLIFNVAFDVPMLAAECDRLGRPCPLTYQQCACMMETYAEWVGDWSRYHHNYRWYPLPGGGHRALDDCRAVLTLLHQLATAVPASPYPAPPPEELAAIVAPAAAAADEIPF